ncbi:MAG: hypothetical protein ACXWUS_14835 [Burkholderiales bacterium]
MTPATLLAAARFFARLPLYLHQRVELSEARTMLANRLENRGRRLLDRLRHDIYARPDSVYCRLLRHAGIEYDEVAAMVARDGVDGALAQLFRAGVYLTVDEFKGRAHVRRGSLDLEVTPELLRSPRAAYHLRGSSGGSRSSGTPVLMDLRFIRDCGANCSLLLDAWGLRDALIATMESPGAGARFRLVKFGAFTRPSAWFTQIHPDHASLESVVRWNTRAMRAASLLAGRPFPSPVYAPLSDPEPAALWLASMIREGRIPIVFTFASTAVRVCASAQERGIDIAGAYFLLMGEPITEARKAAIRNVGAVPIARYGSMEAGAIGYGCTHGIYPDDLHLLSDMQALITAGDGAREAALRPDALLLTSLHPRSPFLLLNASMGDQAVLEPSACGCALERLGWTTRVHSVRSFEKLTAGGVTFLGADVIRILEEALPARFGGKPTDYQLVEHESAGGQPILELLVHPALGPLDEAAVGDAFLNDLAQGPYPAARMTQVWRDSGTLRVVRRAPLVSQAGKILHLHRA